MNKTIIVAGVNHNGDIETAKRLIDVASEENKFFSTAFDIDEVTYLNEIEIVKLVKTVL